MKGKILGCYSFTSKAGKELYNFSLAEDRINCIGVCTTNVFCNKDVLPAAPEKMLNKTYIIDVRGSYANSFYEFNESK